MRRSRALPLPVARRAAWRVRPLQHRRVPFWVWFSVIGLAAAALLPVLRTSDQTAAAATLRDLEQARTRQTAEVRLLASQVGQLAALSRVEAVARERLGLTPARPTVVLSVEEPPPVQVLPSRYLPQRTAPTESEPPGWQRLLDFVIVR